jgi:hypothetical protein
MRKILFSLAAFALVAGMGALSAQNQSELSSTDADKTDAHDRPIGKVSIKLPAPNGGGGNGGPSTEPPKTDPIPPSEGEEIPPTEGGPEEPPVEDPPTYYGEPVQGKFAFLLDASGSMYGSRIATVRAETTSVIQDLTEDDEFDCVAYGSQFPASQDYSTFMWGALLPGTEGNKSAAVSWVNGPSTNPGGGTPTYACLKKSCQVYPADLDKMFLLTDGSPNVSGSASQILADFPTWWSKFDDTELVAVCIGGYGSAQTFMQQLAALAGGTYIAA